MDKTATTAPALQRGLQILELLAESQEPMKLTALGEALKLPVTSLQRMVNQLNQEGYILRTANGGYYLSNKLYRIAYNPKADDLLLQTALPVMRIFVLESSESIHISVPIVDQFVVIGQLAGTSLVRITVRPGSYPIAEFPSGQVLLVYKARGAEASELAKVPARKRKQIEEEGCSFGESHLDRGIYHLAVPIILTDGTCVGSLATSFAIPAGHKAADTRRAELEALIKKSAAEISERIG